jgi:hypothetical protein
MTTSGLIGMFTLPFSETQYFHFNPDPNFAVVLATLSYPFLTSLILYSLFELSRNRFGVMSITGTIFISISTATVIIPNESLISTIPFYVINIIPIIMADVVLSISTKRISTYLIGALIGASFFMMQYPMIIYIYNEAFNKQIVWPSLISSVYFGAISTVYPLIVGPAIAMGILGTLVASKLVCRYNDVVTYYNHQERNS